MVKLCWFNGSNYPSQTLRKLNNACESGDLKTVEQIYENENISKEDIKNVLLNAVINGHLHILKYLVSKKKPRTFF